MCLQALALVLDWLNTADLANQEWVEQGEIENCNCDVLSSLICNLLDKLCNG